MPNLAVDMNSWARSACYPRSTFCPLSDGASTRHRQITKTDFRPCSTCLSHSQAPFCLYTYTLISDQRKETFAHLRYSLGGDRPSQTARLTLSAYPLSGHTLEIYPDKGGISPTTPPNLTTRPPSLPPILHMSAQISMPGYSKGSRGLPV